MENFDPSLESQCCASTAVLYSYNLSGLTDIQTGKTSQVSFGFL